MHVVDADKYTRSKEIHVHWEENSGGEPHKQRTARSKPLKRGMVITAVEFFAGTFAEQWQEAGVVASAELPEDAGGKVVRLARTCPHKHGGCNLVAGNAHGDTKGIPDGHGGVYYDACIRVPLEVGVRVPKGTIIKVGYDMAEPGRGLHLGCLVYGYEEG